MPIKIVDYKVDETGRLLALNQNFMGQLFDVLIFYKVALLLMYPLVGMVYLKNKSK